MRWNQYTKSLYGLSLSDIIIAVIVVLCAAYLGTNAIKDRQSEDNLKQVLEGRVLVNDGDSLTLHGQRIRLLGIDAPELHQYCGYNQNDACGVTAKKYLEQLISGQKVKCFWEKKDKYDRFLAKCQLGDQSINAKMVRDGWAVSYFDYPDEEAEAKAQKRGLWATSFERPRQWRQKHMR